MYGMVNQTLTSNVFTIKGLKTAESINFVSITRYITEYSKYMLYLSFHHTHNIIITCKFCVDKQGEAGGALCPKRTEPALHRDLIYN